MLSSNKGTFKIREIKTNKGIFLFVNSESARLLRVLVRRYTFLSFSVSNFVTSDFLGTLKNPIDVSTLPLDFRRTPGYIR